MCSGTKHKREDREYGGLKKRQKDKRVSRRQEMAVDGTFKYTKVVVIKEASKWK